MNEAGAQFTLREDHKVHVEDMDVQHGRLIGYLEELRSALGRGQQRDAVTGIFRRLIQYLYIHCADEEQFMEANRFPSLADHVALHRQIYQRLAAELAAFESGSSDLKEADVAMIYGWLDEHLTQADSKYGDYFGLERPTSPRSSG